MTWRKLSHAAISGIALAVLVSTAGCVDEKIVYRDGPNFAAPPAAAASFLGYSDEAAKATTCGSCHVGQQAKWKATAHADAFKTLEASGSMQGYCQACHTVNNLGNAATDTTGGWRSTKDKRYHDVQCESCHGAGLQHVQTPTRGQMLASIKADTGKAITTGCSECHTGTHHGFTEDWRASRHATSYTRAYNGATATAPEVPGGPQAACQSCHIGQRVLEAWGVNTNYVEKSQGQTKATAVGVTCAVCHDPHGTPNAANLRFPIDSRDLDNNLCMKCHYRRAVPDFAQGRDSPHSPQGPMLLGEAGWWPPGITIDGDVQAAHGAEKNPKLCATCHVNSYAVTDKATGKFVQNVTGHRFSAIPCVDGNGLPTTNQDCQVSARSFKSCAGSGCHTESRARQIFEVSELDIAGLAAGLNSMIAKVPASEFGAGKVTTARGAKFNVALALHPGSNVHNPTLAKALLRASIAQMAKDYNLTPPVGLNIAPYDRKILGRSVND